MTNENDVPVLFGGWFLGMGRSESASHSAQVTEQWAGVAALESLLHG